MTSNTILLQEAEASSLDSGVFSWDISSDRFFADSAFAFLFGLKAEETLLGLPISTYIDRVHPDDRARVARSIHHAIITGDPCRQVYRVQALSGQYIEISARGRCFRNPNGEPAQYAGIAVPLSHAMEDSDSLVDLCAEAHRVAIQLGRLEAASLLRDAVYQLNGPPIAKPGPSTH